MKPIPESDPDACPDCGEWIKAGIHHECISMEEHYKKIQETIEMLKREIDSHNIPR